MFNPSRLDFAIRRRAIGKAQLAEKLDVSPRTIRNYLSGETTPDLQKLSKILNFPIEFFLSKDLPKINNQSVSFRSKSRMTNKVRDEALTYGITGFILNDWFENEFDLIQAELPDLSHLNPEEAANTLRYDWDIGDKPIGNLIALLESKGIRVFSIYVKSENIDAFSVWHKEKPFIYLNNQKSMERSRFDAAHELGHLVRDIYTMKNDDESNSSVDLDSRVIERMADEFASAFLMPAVTLRQYKDINPTLENLIKLKKVFGVSLVALAYRMHKIGIISDWVYTRVICPEIAKYNYRKTEPEPMPRENSQVLDTMLKELQEDDITIDDISNQVNLFKDDVTPLMFQLSDSIQPLHLFKILA